MAGSRRCPGAPRLASPEGCAGPGIGTCATGRRDGAAVRRQRRLAGWGGGARVASWWGAPAFVLLGSFFRAWLVCFFLGVGFTSLARLALARLHMTVPFPVLVYPSLAALFTFASWLIFF